MFNASLVVLYKAHDRNICFDRNFPAGSSVLPLLLLRLQVPNVWATESDCGLGLMASHKLCDIEQVTKPFWFFLSEKMVIVISTHRVVVKIK